jgi:hypothetical protein
MKTVITTQIEAYAARDQLIDWFQRYTFGNCSDAEEIAVTRDTVQCFIKYHPSLNIVYKPNEQPQGYDVYAGKGIVIVDVGEFRLCYLDKSVL